MSASGNTGLPDDPAIRFAAPADTRLYFSGPPQRVAGTIPLINPTGDKQKLRSLTLDAGKLQGAAGVPLNDVAFSAQLYPGQQAAVRGMLSLDATTPPGSYDIQVKLGSQTLPATVYVTEVVDLRMQPSEITILAGSATSYTRKIIAENRGNVKLLTGSRCEAPIFDSFDLSSSLVIGLHKADKASVETMTKGVLDEWAQLQAGTLVTTREAVTIPPGGKIVADVEFQLPADLKPLRHYHASLQLYNSTLTVNIYTTAKAGSGGGKGKA